MVTWVVLAYHDEWEKITGAFEIAKTCFCVATEVCDKSTILLRISVVLK